MRPSVLRVRVSTQVVGALVNLLLCIGRARCGSRSPAERSRLNVVAPARSHLRTHLYPLRNYLPERQRTRMPGRNDRQKRHAPALSDKTVPTEWGGAPLFLGQWIVTLGQAFADEIRGGGGSDRLF